MSGNYNFNRHETVTNVVFNFLGEVVDINEIHNDLIKFENEMNELKKTIIRYKIDDDDDDDDDDDMYDVIKSFISL